MAVAVFVNAAAFVVDFAECGEGVKDVVSRCLNLSWGRGAGSLADIVSVGGHWEVKRVVVAIGWSSPFVFL